MGKGAEEDGGHTPVQQHGRSSRRERRRGSRRGRRRKGRIL